ncbi:MAG: hydrogen peroxide-inducible genes activator [Caulobacterales bacterium]|nr:hydrogen peroxide-inducible genes activator [Caulobacterales bacterium]
MRYLLALEDAKHYRRAAENCGISQPSLTAQIQNLERALGVHLVERSRSGVALTPVGREVADRARRVLDEVQSLADFAAGAQRGLVGTIRLGAKPTLGPYLLPHVVARLHRLYPDLNLYVREGAPRELEHELSRGVHDVILAQLPVAGSELVTERLFREPLYLAVAADHPLAREPEVTVQHLAGLEVLSLSPLFHLHDQITALCQEFGATLVRDYEGTSLDALRLMVGMGMGVTFLPALYVRSEIPTRGEVVAKKLHGKSIARFVGLVWRKSAGKAESFQQITRVIREVASRRFPDLTVGS